MIGILTRTRRVLGESRVGLAVRVGASKRTGQRWASGESFPTAIQLLELARHVLPRDRRLAADLAAKAGTTLDAIAPPAPPAAPPVATEHLVDSVVCAAVDASGLASSVVRPALLAALERARSLRLDLLAIEGSLRARVGAQ